MRVDREHALRDLVVQHRQPAPSSSKARIVPAMASSSTSLCVTRRTVRGSIVPARTPAVPRRSTKSAGRARAVGAHDVGADVRGIDAARPARSQRVGEPTRAGVIVGEPLDHRLERDDPGRRDHARLAHARRPSGPGARAPRAITSAGPHSSEPTGAPRPFDRQNITVSAGATSSRGDVPSATAAFQMRAPSTCTRSSPVRAMLAQRRHLGRVDRRARLRHVRVLDDEQRRLREMVRDAFDRGADTVGQIPQRVHLHTAVDGRGRGFVAVHVRAVGAQHFGARRGEHADRELVRHRPRRHVQRRLLAEQRCRERLQAIDGGVLAVDVVADLGVGHRAAHLRRRLRDGVGAEIDRAHGSCQPGFTGRISPSWMTVTASAPSWRKMKPSASPRAPCADGLFWWYSSHSSARERAVEPHRVVEARDHEPVVVPRVRVRHHRGVEQREVGRVRDDARVQQRIVGQLSVGAEPHELFGLARARIGIEPSAAAATSACRSGGRA